MKLVFQNKMVYRSLTLAFLFLVTITMSAQWSSPQEEGGVPAFNAGPPPKGTKLPPVLTKADLWGADAQYPYQTHAYELAAKIPDVLHQQPCYCFCDRMGHNSLHSCYENTHGAQCSTCLKELYYSYQQHQKGKTAAQIRAGIIKGEWKQIDLASAASMLRCSNWTCTRPLSDTLLLNQERRFARSSLLPRAQEEFCTWPRNPLRKRL
jgi:hypothetical protein